MEEIDYKAVTAMLQSENEALRLHILALRNAKFSPWSALTTGNLRKFLVSNYIAIAAMGTIFVMAMSLVETIRGIVHQS